MKTSLKNTIDSQIKEAIKSQNQTLLKTLRSIKSLILNAESAEGQIGELTPEQEMKLLVKASKQRKESLAMFTENNRQDLAAIEKEELEIIESFLPKQLTVEEITDKIKTIISSTGATSIKEMGKVMGVATKEFAGLADGKIVSDIVKSLLA